MTSLDRTKSGDFHIIFRFAGRRYKRALKTRQEKEANTRLCRIDETIRLVESGRIELPENVDIPTFLLSDGKRTGVQSTPLPQLTLEATFDDFFASIPKGNLEATTLDGMHRHEKHLLRLFSPDFPFATLTLDNLQKYVNQRIKEKSHFGKPVSAITVHKELVTLGTLWRWAERSRLVSGSFPRRGIRLPKQDELPPFQTWDEIERQIEQGGLDEAQASMLWDALYLKKSEVDELIAHVKKHALHPFIYPMIVMAAHTGARRSELMRSQRLDFDLEGSVITIREKKRVRGRNSTRRVPMSPILKAAITEWFEKEHPGGSHAFCHGVRSSRSRSKAKHASPLTNDQAHAHLERTLKGSKWEKVKGWHCLRHSFISNLASQGIDQRIIDDFVGHTTEQMRRRYRHLFPDVKQAAINAVFG